MSKYPTIKTGSWFTKLPEGHVKISISRTMPQYQPHDTMIYRNLAPGHWFKSVSYADYLERHSDQLAAIDPEWLIHHLGFMGQDKTPVLCCYESPKQIDAGKKWCHRHLVAEWFENTLGITVEELGYPKLDRFRMLREQGVMTEDRARRPEGAKPMQIGFRF